MTKLVSLLALSATLVGSLEAAQRRHLKFQFINRSGYVVSLKLYSQLRNGWQWPNGQEHWYMDDTKLSIYDIDCVQGERISWGAWIEGTTKYWGSGKDDEQACDDCVYVCGKSNPKIQILNL
jgi:hypothetical protein